jgi:hypothetical protein
MIVSVIHKAKFSDGGDNANNSNHTQYRRCYEFVKREEDPENICPVFSGSSYYDIISYLFSLS